MGCLRNIIRAIILTLAIIGFMSLGGRELLRGWMADWFNPSQDTMIERAKKVGDFSKINDEFEIEKAGSVFGYTGVYAEHKATGQKMFVIDSGVKPLLKEEDITAANAEDRLKNSVKNFKQAISVDDIKVTKRGTITSYGKTVPYIKVEAKIKKLPKGDYGGIVAVVKDSNGKDKILISGNEKDKYSQLIADEFFKNIR